MNARTIVAQLAAVALVASACAGQAGGPDTSVPATTPTTIEEPESSMPDETIEPTEPTTEATTPTTSAPQGTLAEQAITDLAARLEIDSGEIVLVSWEEVTWPDGSIGCPLPGMRYTQAIVNGSKIVLEVDGVEYRYHQGGNRELFLCEQPTLDKGVAPPTTSLDL